MTRQEYLRKKLELEKLRVQANLYKERNGLEFWEPFEHQQMALDLVHSGKKTVLLQGGNRIGKTVLGSCVVGSACLGKELWHRGGNGEYIDSVFGGGKVRVRIICVDWEHHAKEVIVPSLVEWLPYGSYETKKNNTGVDAFWYFKNGSSIELMTHIQETKIHEGWKGHLVWADEPLPRDKYVANKRGLIDFSGVFLLTMTAVYEAWILDEIVLKSDDKSIGCVTDVPMRANPLLSDTDIDNYGNSLTAEEYEPRIKGGWLQLTGKVLKEFNRDKHIIDRIKDVSSDWVVVGMIDLHLSEKQAIGFYAFDRNNICYVIDEIWDNLSPEDISLKIIEKKRDRGWNLKHVFIDPLAKGDTQYIKNRQFGDIEDSFTIIHRKLGENGILLSIASKDKDSGIRNLQEMLRGVNKVPILYFCDNCERHIWEIQRWVYDEKTQKPKKENDHFMENLYRLTLTGIRYIEGGNNRHVLEYEPVNDVVGW